MKTRITVVETVHCEGGDGAPATASSRFNYTTESADQPYVRRLRIGGQEWVPLDYGWLTNPSMLVVENIGPPPLQVNPTEEQKADLRSCILQVALDSQVLCGVPIGQSFRLPRPSNRLFIRCIGTLPSTGAVVHAFPG